GRGCSRIESSMSVAVTTGLPAARASEMSCFCTVGTRSNGISTPRSPRATMIPSKAATMLAARSTASGRSILAMTGTLIPAARADANLLKQLRLGENEVPWFARIGTLAEIHLLAIEEFTFRTEAHPQLGPWQVREDGNVSLQIGRRLTQPGDPADVLVRRPV